MKMERATPLSLSYHTTLDPKWSKPHGLSVWATLNGKRAKVLNIEWGDGSTGRDCLVPARAVGNRVAGAGGHAPHRSLTAVAQAGPRAPCTTSRASCRKQCIDDLDHAQRLYRRATVRLTDSHGGGDDGSDEEAHTGSEGRTNAEATGDRRQVRSDTQATGDRRQVRSDTEKEQSLDHSQVCEAPHGDREAFELGVV